jgi:hypothetical protein
MLVLQSQERAAHMAAAGRVKLKHLTLPSYPPELHRVLEPIVVKFSLWDTARKKDS